MKQLFGWTLAVGLMATATTSHALLGILLPGPNEPETGDVIAEGEVIDGQYIVVFNDDAGPLGALISNALGLVGGTLLGELPIIHGAVVQLDHLSARILAALPSVAYVEQDQVMRAVGDTAVQDNPPWGLDRIDNRDGLTGAFVYPADAGAGSHIFIIDTGVRSGHQDFTGRVAGGRNFVVDGPLGGLPIPLLGPILEGLLGGLLGGEVDPDNFEDCNGHGTHVAGSAAGTEFGVAKQASIWAVRVLGCSGGGSNAGVIAGVDWVAQQAATLDGPVVANMSLGGGNSTALDEAVRNATLDANVVMVVAAGNDNADACSGSPNRVAEAITVGSTAIDDSRSSFSNRGSCVDIFAPGSNIASAWHTGDSASNTISGTSMAAPHAAGVAATYFAANPDWEADVVFSNVVLSATEGALSGIGAGSPNRLLFLDPAVAIAAGGSPQTATAPVDDDADAETAAAGSGSRRGLLSRLLGR